MVKRMYTTFAEDRVIQLIAFLGFVFGLSISLLAYVTSSYFKEVIMSDNVSLFYVVIFCILLVALFKLNRIIEGFGRARTLLTLLAAQVGVLLALQLSPVSWGGAILMMIYYILYGIVAIVFDIVLEAYSTNGHTGRVRGFYLSVWNFGILVGPLISMFLLEHYGFFMIFTVTLVLYAMMFLVAFIALNDVQGHVIPQQLHTKNVIYKFLHNRALLNIYLVSLTLNFFYAAMTIYMPLYLRNIGLTWGDIGMIFMVMLVPFIFLQYPAGVLADKKYGEKEMLLMGLSIMVVSIGMMFFSTSRTFVFWATVLFFSRIGAALVEELQDSYFYKQINENDIALINFFRSTRAVAYIASAISVGMALWIFADMRIFFVVIGCVLLAGFLPVFMLKDSAPVTEGRGV
jgi:MFS family permease